MPPTEFQARTKFDRLVAISPNEVIRAVKQLSDVREGVAAQPGEDLSLLVASAVATIAAFDFEQRSGEPRIAVLAPCWQESAVLERMLQRNVENIQYGNYDIWIGLYPNTFPERAMVGLRYPF